MDTKGIIQKKKKSKNVLEKSQKIKASKKLKFQGTTKSEKKSVKKVLTPKIKSKKHNESLANGFKMHRENLKRMQKELKRKIKQLNLETVAQETPKTTKYGGYMLYREVQQFEDYSGGYENGNDDFPVYDWNIPKSFSVELRTDLSKNELLKECKILEEKLSNIKPKNFKLLAFKQTNGEAGIKNSMDSKAFKVNFKAYEKVADENAIKIGRNSTFLDSGERKATTMSSTLSPISFKTQLSDESSIDELSIDELTSKIVHRRLKKNQEKNDCEIIEINSISSNSESFKLKALDINFTKTFLTEWSESEVRHTETAEETWESARESLSNEASFNDLSFTDMTSQTFDISRSESVDSAQFLSAED